MVEDLHWEMDSVEGSERVETGSVETGFNPESKTQKERYR